ncbi:hypothetical protein OAV38_00185 [Candidatus Thioglobus sp.]|jgi:hypothetical protein|nr:hypothetical protein [bacterium]MDC3329264.1 hypothetical protein [Candidatus Thioglobus sp.]
MKISFIKLISIMFLISFITSCASVKDFQKMNKDQRAVKLCKGSSVVSSYDIKIRHSRSKLNNIESLLTKGYRSVESCNTKVVDTGKKDKKGVAIIRTSKSCSDNLIPLTFYAVESLSAEMSDLKAVIPGMVEMRDKKYNSCKLEYGRLSAEEAFSIYESQ